MLFHHVAGLVSHLHTLAVDDEPSAFYTMVRPLPAPPIPMPHKQAYDELMVD